MCGSARLLRSAFPTALTPAMRDRLEAALPVLEALLFLVLLGWLCAAAALVETEYYDGYDTILNARYFLGYTSTYQITRAPLVAWLLVPAEAFRHVLSMHPLEVRPHHASMALLHAAYLVGAYVTLVRVRGRNLASWLAFLLAVPVFLFFSYAPFLSHDIAPGWLLVTMVLMADRFLEQPRVVHWMSLVLLGTAAALVKHVYSLFWLFVLAGPVLVGIVHHKRRAVLPAVWLGIGAAVSGMLTIAALGVALEDALPGVPFLERALHQVRFLGFDAPAAIHRAPVWIYARNLPAFGVAAMLLVPAGLWMSCRRDRTSRACALVWVLAVTTQHLIGVREVRYLAFLAPLTALLIAEPIARLLRRRFGLPIVGLAWAAGLFGPYSPVAEAAHALSPYHRESELRALLAPIESKGTLRTPLLVNWQALSFTHERNAPLVADIYHGVFHFGLHHLMHFYGLSGAKVRRLAPGELAHLNTWEDRAVMILATSGPVTNSLGWTRTRAIHKDILDQAVFVARTYEFPQETVVRRSVDAGAGTVVRHPSLAALRERLALPRWSMRGRTEWGPVDAALSTEWVLVGAGDTPALAPVTIHGFERLGGAERVARSGKSEIPVNEPEQAR